MPSPRRTNRTSKKDRRDWKPVWLEAFSIEGTVTAACKTAEVGRTTVYDAREADEAFAQAWDDLENATTERMEREAYRRAVDGVDRDVLYKGGVVGTETHFSDTLLIFMLKARRPDVYRERFDVQHSGQGGGPLKVQLTPPEDAKDRSIRAAEHLQTAGAITANGNGNGNGHH